MLDFYSAFNLVEPFFSSHLKLFEPFSIVQLFVAYPLWAGVDLRYNLGGSLKLDDVDQDNGINLLGGGISVGYQILSFVSASASYGGILFGDNDAKSEMLRFSLIFVYANTKKLTK